MIQNLRTIINEIKVNKPGRIQLLSDSPFSSFHEFEIDGTRIVAVVKDSEDKVEVTYNIHSARIKTFLDKIKNKHTIRE